MMTVRLDNGLEQRIEEMSESLGISKSELIRRSVQQFIESVSKPTPWEAGKELFGKFRSGRSDLSTNRKAIVNEMVLRKFK
jgi:Arc/MetJ-type ribon-helix-helix transcriptional regulator